MGNIVSSIGDAVGGLIGGSQAPNAPNIQVFQPSNTGAADTQAFNAIGQVQNNNPYYQYQPNYQAILSSFMNNPYATGAQTAANQGGAATTAVGNADLTQAGNINAGANANLNAAGQILNTAFDPQTALYNQEYQKAQDASRVAQASRGITSSPYGANLESEALNNFNLNWQNNLLNRESTGLTAANQALTGANTASTGAGNIGASGANNLVAGGSIPNTAYTDNLATMLQALNGYGQSQTAGNNNTQTAIQDLLQYLGISAGQSNSQAGFTQTSYQDALAQAANQGSGIGSLLTGLGGMLPGFPGGDSIDTTGIPAGGFAGATGVPAAGGGGGLDLSSIISLAALFA